ncbi:hypothetical protein TKK_0000426 [Trichogramma kaykai]
MMLMMVVWAATGAAYDPGRRLVAADDRATHIRPACDRRVGQACQALAQPRAQRAPAQQAQIDEPQQEAQQVSGGP